MTSLATLPTQRWLSGIRRKFAPHFLCLKLPWIFHVYDCVDLAGATYRLVLLGKRPQDRYPRHKKEKKKD